MKENAKKYLICVAVPIVVAAIMLALSWAFLQRAGEYRDMDEVVTRQIENGGLYNSALEQMSYGYKQALYRHVKPAVVALGSSRAMQFQGEIFTVPFVTLGGAASGFYELEKSLRQMLSVHKPELVIVGLDFWWFNDAYAEPAKDAAARRFQEKFDVRLEHLVEPYIWLVEGKLTPSVFLSVLKESPKHQGIAPIAKGDGYDAHGAYHYVSEALSVPEKPYDWDRRRMESGERMYATGDDISEDRWQQFDGIVRMLEGENIKFILFLPPMSPVGYEFLKNSGRHDYIEKLRQRLSSYRYHVYDYHDPETLGGNACEFVDAFHAGPIFYRRILLDLAMQENSPLAPYVDVNRIFEDIKMHQGHATLWPDGMFPALKEVDFLGIGCEK